MEKRLMMFIACVFLNLGMALAQTHVSGVVTSSEDGSPIIGASVKIVGTTSGTVTDIDGNFTLDVASNKAELEFSYIGMVTKKLKASDKMQVILDPDTHVLEQVIITGYGAAKKLGSVVGAISNIGEKKLETVVTPNFTDALAGQVSGLSVLSSAGDPSQSAQIRLRGVNSIGSSNQPLFILDGSPITASFFSTLNPSDIANITVLKDAASTSIYGSRAANGVIVITTKQAKYNESVQLTVKAQYGISSATSKGEEMMNSQQYIQFRDMIGQPVNDNIRNLVNKYGISTDWRDEMIKNSAPTSDINATLQGGGQTMNYFVSFNHHQEDGLIEDSNMRRSTLAARINSRLNKFFKVGFSSNFGVQDYSQNSMWADSKKTYASNPLVAAKMALPYDTPYYYSFDEAGNLVKGDRAAGLLYSQFLLPWFTVANTNQDRKNVTINLSLNEQLTPCEGLTFTALQSMFGYDLTSDRASLPYDQFTTPMGQVIDAHTGGVASNFSRYYAYTLTHTAEYRHNFGPHYINLLLGEETRIQKGRGIGIVTTGQTDSRRMLLNTATTITPSAQTDSRSEEVANSLFGTAEYNYNEKYYVYASLRFDGSSKFAPDHRWGTFGSLGLKWNAKRENFLRGLRWLDDLTVSANYGTTGNDSGAGSYDFYGLFGSGKNYNGEGSIDITQASNDKLTWEKVSKLNIGLNFGLFNRVTVDANFYRNETSDMLMEIPYSMTTGFASGMGNIGNMVNKGFETTVNVDLIKTKDMSWSVSANICYNKNEITELFAGRNEYVLSGTGLKLQVGHAYGEFYNVRYAGVDSRTGEPMWYDKNGNITKTYDETNNSVFLGKNRYAPWIGGFGTNFTWKGLSVIADFAWQSGKYMLVNDDYFIKNANMGTSYNQCVDMLNVWTTPGQVTDIPAYGYETYLDDHTLSNASFLRMKTLTVQYQLPKSWMQTIRYIKDIKVFGIARNLFTITPFEGYDPEPDKNLVHFNYPNTRQFVIGAELTF